MCCCRFYRTFLRSHRLRVRVRVCVCVCARESVCVCCAFCVCARRLCRACACVHVSALPGAKYAHGFIKPSNGHLTLPSAFARHVVVTEFGVVILYIYIFYFRRLNHTILRYCVR